MSDILMTVVIRLFYKSYISATVWNEAACTVLKIARYDYNLTIMKSPKLTTDTIYPHIKLWWYRTMLNFYPPFSCRVLAAILKMADILNIWKRRIALLMGTYHYVKIYVSIIIQLEVININVRNFKFPIGFYSNPHPLWTPKNMTLTPFNTNLKKLGSTRNIYL
jgi:predicted choloylglycine hydrolase